MKLVSLLLLTAAVMTGCSLLDAGAGAGSSPDEPIAGNSGADPPPAGEDRVRTEPDPAIVDARSVTIDGFAIGPDGRTLAILYQGGTPACFGLQQVLLEVQRGTPIVSVLEGRHPETVGQPCDALLVAKFTVVTLDDPILVDGSGAHHPAGEPLLDAEPLRLVTVAPRIVDERVHAVEGYRLSPDGRTLTVIYVGGVEECYGLADASVEPAEDGALRVTVREGWRQGVDNACPDLGVLKGVRVELAEPLIVQAAFDS